MTQTSGGVLEPGIVGLEAVARRRSPCSRSAASTAGPGLGELDDELVEHRPGESLLHARDRAEPVGGIGRFLDVLPGHLPQPLLAQGLQEDRRPQGAEGLVGADVRGGPLAADVLLAGGQRQDEAAPAVLVDRLAGDPAGHLAQEFLLAGHEAEVGPAEAQREAERLGLAGDDVGPELARALRAEPSGQGLGDDGHRQGLDAVGGVGEGLDVLDDAEEVRRLIDDGGRLVVERAAELGRVDPAVGAEPDFDGLDAEVLDVGPDDLPVLRMEGARPGRPCSGS